MCSVFTSVEESKQTNKQYIILMIYKLQVYI